MKRQGRVEFYTDKKKEIRWRIIGKNGAILADSGEGYKRRTTAERGLYAVFAVILSVAIADAQEAAPHE